MRLLNSLFYIFIVFVTFSCKEKDEREGVVWKNIEKTLQTQLITAQSGDTLFLPEGYFWFTKSLVLEQKEHIVIKGAGIDKTVLSFRGQESGAEGIKVASCKQIELSDFTIEDAKGDNIKVRDTDGISFKRIKTWWTGGAKESNGAYAIYPVLCKNVLIEECIAARASDAGIYVGQSDTVIIRRNIAFENVAGIESENSNFVDIYENHAFNNTGGILVFDLPGLTQYGAHTRVFNNLCENNNHRNFAPSGNIVGMIPPGTGLMLLATRDIEIFNNKIEHNRSSGLAMVSYELILALDDNTDESTSGSAPSLGTHNNNYALDSLYNPYIEQVYVYDNHFKNKHWFPSLSNDIGRLLAWKQMFRTPDVLWDGFTSTGEIKSADICLHLDAKTRFLNINAPNDLKEMKKDTDQHNCRRAALPPVVIKAKSMAVPLDLES